VRILRDGPARIDCERASAYDGGEQRDRSTVPDVPESLNDLWACFYCEFERFDGLNMMPSLGDGAMTGVAERSRCDGKGRVESSDESTIHRYRLDL
jgi:hypothetical protein